MNRVNLVKFNFRFETMGALAPEVILENEIWLDVGNKVGPQVLDHHGGDTEAWSTAQLVFENYQDFLLTPMANKKEIELVLHTSPDLDTICSTWLVEMLFKYGKDFLQSKEIEKIVRAVSENDQGMVRTSNPEKNWVIVARTIIDSELKNEGNLGTVKKGLLLFKKTYEVLKDGGELGDAASGIITYFVKSVFAHARRDYIEDLDRAIFFQVKLPVRTYSTKSRKYENKPAKIPNSFTERWSLTDGIYINEPSSSLFKELAWGDTEKSLMKQGFSFMVVSRNLKVVKKPYVQRHIISTDPLSGLHLEGLGALLEKREQEKEDKGRQPLLPGRKRVRPGKGRHGYNVESPWYDGRGHDFTIVDSPSLHIRKKAECFSILDSTEVLEIIWEYGDPSRFMRVLEFELTVFYPVKLKPGWKKNWQERSTLSDLCHYFCEELLYSESLVSIYPMTGSRLPGDPGEVELLDQKLWLFFDESSLWMGRFKFKSQLTTLKDIIQVISDFNDQKIIPYFAEGIIEDEYSDPIHLLHLRMNPKDVFLTKDSGPTSQALFLLATGQKPLFFKQPGLDELEKTKRVLSSDKHNLFFLSHRGMVVLSNRSISFKDEKDFHRPELFSLIAGLAIGKRLCVEKLSAEFVQHRLEKSPTKAGKLVISDREKLSRLEQEMEFSKVTDIRFGQMSFEALIEQFEIGKKLDVARKKIDSLAKFVRQSRENLYQKITILVTVLLAPLIIAISFTESARLQKSLEKIYHAIFPSHWVQSGWFHFLFVFFLISLLITSFWIFLTLKQRKKNILNWFRKLRKKKK